MKLLSFVTKKDLCKKLELIQSGEPSSSSSSSPPAAVKFKIVSTSLSANNKFYISFGDKPPFNFFNAFPVLEGSQLVDADGDKKIISAEYAHPPVWGLCEVTESAMPEVLVGSIFRAMLPLGTEAEFEKAHVEPKLGCLMVHRPTTHAAYNAFAPIPADSVCHPSQTASSGLALVCFPGILTGFGLYFALQHEHYYGCNTVVVTSASCKVALAFALYAKQGAEGKKIIGYTSEANKAFCESTNLYAEVLTYDEPLPGTVEGDVVMIEVSGRGDIYTKNQSRVKKLLLVGNASGTPDKDSTGSGFTAYAKVKMLLTIMGGPKWIRKRMNPTQELFLIMDTSAALQEEHGKEKYLQIVEDYTKTFCDEASKWMKARKCDTEESIHSAFEDIMEGSVPPSEFVLLDVAKAVAHRNQ